MKPNIFQKTTTHATDVMYVKDVAEFFNMSPSWVYRHYKKLGGVKIGGTVLFPKKEEIYERLFQQEEEVVGVLFPLPKKSIHKSRLQTKKRRLGSGSRKKKTSKTIISSKTTGANRHGIFDFA